MPESLSRFAAINQKSQPVAIKTVNDHTVDRPTDRTTGRPQGKRSNPDFEKVGLYLHSERRKRAERKWEDEGEGDFSDLIDKLLTSYLNER